MENKKIRVLIVKSDLEPYETEIENDYKAEQKIVDGSIDVIEFPTMKNVDIIVNDEFLNLRLPGNFYLPHIEGVVCGDCIITGYNPNDGDNKSLTKKQIKECKEYIKTFRIPPELDFYNCHDLIKKEMKFKQKLYDKRLSEM